jgi:hypothetical protein
MPKPLSPRILGSFYCQYDFGNIRHKMNPYSRCWNEASVSQGFYQSCDGTRTAYEGSPTFTYDPATFKTELTFPSRTTELIVMDTCLCYMMKDESGAETLECTASFQTEDYCYVPSNCVGSTPALNPFTLSNEHNHEVNFGDVRFQINSDPKCWPNDQTYLYKDCASGITGGATFVG